jgi:hypothetical protein
VLAPCWGRRRQGKTAPSWRVRGRAEFGAAILQKLRPGLTVCRAGWLGGLPLVATLFHETLRARGVCADQRQNQCYFSR